ncbi:hypothetical protein [Deinococcus sp. PEB2-63]
MSSPALTSTTDAPPDTCRTLAGWAVTAACLSTGQQRPDRRTPRRARPVRLRRRRRRPGPITALAARGIDAARASDPHIH